MGQYTRVRCELICKPEHKETGLEKILMELGNPMEGDVEVTEEEFVNSKTLEPLLKMTADVEQNCNYGWLAKITTGSFIDNFIKESRALECSWSQRNIENDWDTVTSSDSFDELDVQAY